MGARGRGALVHNRAAHKNARPGAHSRAIAIVRGEVAEGSAGYWDLVIGPREGHPSPWPSRRSPARRQAWLAWRDRIRTRWRHAWSHGRRPSAWWAFDAPALLAKRDDLTTEAIEAMTDIELVYVLDAGPAERRDIEDDWHRAIEHAADATGGDRAAWRAHATDPEAWDVPGWFFDRIVAGK